jgi:NAD(P)-dependent dehydrogenase (short-subunit alcohol dehydrogenase family)
MTHPAFAPGKVAVITGAADGIGLAAATRLAAAGMKVVLVDLDRAKLEAAVAACGHGARAFAVDVSDRAAVEALAKTVASEVGPISVLMNNAGVGGGGKAWSNPDGWDKVLGTNLHGVIHGLQAFVPAMIKGGQRGIVVNTGSKQGITNPPGDTAYNCSKAAVRSLTEGLAHSLREATDGRVTAHLLIPGFTYTGMIAKHVPDRPAGAWSADQVVDVMLAGIEDGAFYLWCLDNETSLETDNRRVLWSAGDIVENRPALSRWHPDHSDAFKAFMARATLD